MGTVVVGGQRVRLDPSTSIGKGGEAEVYLYQGKALKVFKEPTHPDFQGDTHAQKAAKERIALHQRKLPAFPKGLPSQVIAPQELANDLNGAVAGYTMTFLKGAEVLMRYADRGFRQQGVPNDQVTVIFKKLHGLVQQIHKAGVVMGDFNDLNVLVGQDIYLVDADSYQFKAGSETFFCTTFTNKFVDPLLCDPKQSSLLLSQPHNEASDWYAFCVMLMNCLLYVDPYGGVYRPHDPAKRVNHDARPLHRITVFNPEVKYPKPAIPYGVLPDELLQWFCDVFERDRRHEFPIQFLQFNWTKCTNCGLEHARRACPDCARTGVVKETLTVRGNVTATRIFKTDGTILYATYQGGKLLWIYHDGTSFCREDGTRVLQGPVNPHLRFRLQAGATYAGFGGQVAKLQAGKPNEQLRTDSFGNRPVFDTNEKHVYTLQNGQLLHDVLGAEYVGDVLAGRTLFWVGPEFGMGFYQAGGLAVHFVFKADRGRINDQVKLPSIKGQLVDSTCVFGQNRAWFFTSESDGGRIINRCHVLKGDGTLVASAEAEAGTDHWLGEIRGKCAIGAFLLSGTDDGIVRVEPDGTTLKVVKEFPDTEPWVNAKSALFPGPGGIYVVGSKDITLLKIS
jgi:tRNA A-37 threonylcarbamoyl transferase component Bud32